MDAIIVDWMEKNLTVRAAVALTEAIVDFQNNGGIIKLCNVLNSIQTKNADLDLNLTVQGPFILHNDYPSKLVEYELYCKSYATGDVATMPI